MRMLLKRLWSASYKAWVRQDIDMMRTSRGSIHMRHHIWGQGHHGQCIDSHNSPPLPPPTAHPPSDTVPISKTDSPVASRKVGQGKKKRRDLGTIAHRLASARGLLRRPNDVNKRRLPELPGLAFLRPKIKFTLFKNWLASKFLIIY